MDPVTAIVFAGLLTVVPATNRSKTDRNVEDISSTVYVIDRRNYARNDSPIVLDSSFETVASNDKVEITNFNEPVFAELITYKSFRDGWDGEGSLAPDLSSIDAAIAFAEMARPYLSAPSAMLGYDGEIGLYWNTPEMHIDIAFERGGTISIYSRDRRAVPNIEEFISGLDPVKLESLLPLMDKLAPAALAA